MSRKKRLKLKECAPYRSLWPPSQPPKHYQIYIHHRDLARIRALEYYWDRPRVGVIAALLDLVPSAEGCRIVEAAPDVWARLARLAEPLDLREEDLAARLLALLSHSTADQLLALLHDPSS